MTEKRYELKCHETNSWHIEKDGKVIIFDLFKSDAEILCTELNSLSDENEQLKSSNMEMEDYLGRLEEENEQLKGEVAHYKLILMSLEKEAKRLSQIR